MIAELVLVPGKLESDGMQQLLYRGKLEFTLLQRNWILFKKEKKNLAECKALSVACVYT